LTELEHLREEAEAAYHRALAVVLCGDAVTLQTAMSANLVAYDQYTSELVRRFRDGELIERIDNETPQPAERCVILCPQCEGEGSYADGLDEAACSTPCTRCGTNGWIVDLKAAPFLATFAALSPFAECCDQIGEDESDEEWAKFRLLIGDYRRASAALGELQ